MAQGLRMARLLDPAGLLVIALSPNSKKLRRCKKYRWPERVRPAVELFQFRIVTDDAATVRCLS